jgi:hypothetical protein
LGWFLHQDVFLGHQNAPIMTGKKLYTTLFATPNMALEDKKKGRNDLLIRKRNKCLVARYFYYCHLKYKKYDACMTLLQAEFFLTSRHINNIIQENLEELQSLKELKNCIAHFQQHWPQYKW